LNGQGVGIESAKNKQVLNRSGSIHRAVDGIVLLFLCTFASQPCIMQNDRGQISTNSEERQLENFRSVFYAQYPKLYGFCLRNLYNPIDAEDVVQETFAAAWENRGKIDLSKNFNAYLLSIAKNKIYDLIRQKFVLDRHRNRISESMQEQLSEEDRLLWNDLVNLMFSSMEQLPDRQREILLLRAQGFSNPEIAERLGLSIRTIENHYSRALATIRTIMGPKATLVFSLFFLDIF